MCIQFRVFENFFTLNIQSRYSKRYYTLYSNQIGMDRKANNEDDDKRTKMLKILCRAVVVKIKTLDSKIYQFFVKRNFKRTKNQIHAGNIQKFNEKNGQRRRKHYIDEKNPTATIRTTMSIFSSLVCDITPLLLTITGYLCSNARHRRSPDKEILPTHTILIPRNQCIDIKQN